MKLLEKALFIALQAHSEQVDKSSVPYILHPLKVMLKMETETEMILGVLHDVVEDNDEWNIERIKGEGFSNEIIVALDCLTRRKKESYEDFIDRLKNNELARKVKIADIEENINIGRLKVLQEKDIERIKKYHKALGILKAI